MNVGDKVCGWVVTSVETRGEPVVETIERNPAPACPVRLGQVVRLAGKVATVYAIEQDEIGWPVITVKYLGNRKERVELGTLLALAA